MGRLKAVSIPLNSSSHVLHLVLRVLVWLSCCSPLAAASDSLPELNWDASQGTSTQRALKLHDHVSLSIQMIARKVKWEFVLQDHVVESYRASHGDRIARAYLTPLVIDWPQARSIADRLTNSLEKLEHARVEMDELAANLRAQPGDCEVAARLRAACYEAWMMYVEEHWRLQSDVALANTAASQSIWSDLQQIRQSAEAERTALEQLINEQNSIAEKLQIANMQYAQLAVSYGQIATAEGDLQSARDLKRTQLQLRTQLVQLSPELRQIELQAAGNETALNMTRNHSDMSTQPPISVGTR